MSSRVFGKKGPAKPHFSQATGGVAAEVTDLRSDLEATFLQLQADAVGTTAERTDSDFQDTLYSGFLFWDTTLKKLFAWNAADTTWYAAGKGATVSNTTATNVAVKQWHVETLIPPMPGQSYVGQYAAGAAIDDSVGPFTAHFPYRTARAVLGVAAVATVVTITGTDSSGAVITDTITCSGTGTFEGTKAFATVTAVSTDVDPGDTLDIKTGKGFALAVPFTADTVTLAVFGVIQTPVAVDPGTGTVVPNTASNGAINFCVRYQDAGTTVTQNAHTHTLS